MKAKYFTTGDVARVAGVAPRTASMWFDRGILQGWLVPGLGKVHHPHRRYDPVVVTKFLLDNGMPVPDELDRYLPLAQRDETNGP